MSKNEIITDKSVIHSIKDTFESLVIAFILAFVFRAFVVEAFVIPTGSMADTLRGAHFRLTCQTCGYQYNYGFDTRYYGIDKGKIPSRPLKISVPNAGLRKQNTLYPICPMCGSPVVNELDRHVANGDRILVLKYLYQFVEPSRWDVVVFKNPWNPYENYIKRLVAKPGEALQIIDGDIYIDGTIQTKPDMVQNALWIKIFDNFYQPDDDRVQPEWRQPFVPGSLESGWTLDQARHKITFTGNSKNATLHFDQNRLDRLTRSFCAYNGETVDPWSQCSDLKFYTLIIPTGDSGSFEVRLGKYEHEYTGRLDFSGLIQIIDQATGEILAEETVSPVKPNQPIPFSFALLDHTLQLRLGDRDPLIYVGPNDPKAWGYRPGDPHPAPQLPPSVALNARGDGFELETVELYRDIYYVSLHGSQSVRGSEQHPIKLKEDQFFVCGDNSPQSYDSRLWEQKGITNDDNKLYDAGIVPRDYMIGKAFFVYWPAGFRPTESTRIAIIPNFGQMRFIY